MNTPPTHFMRLLRKICHICLRNFVHCSPIFLTFKEEYIRITYNSGRFSHT
jgi:hypothetical protein